MTPRKQFLFTLDDSVRESLRRYAFEHDTSMASVVREAIDAWIEPSTPRRERKKRPLSALIGIVRGGQDPAGPPLSESAHEQWVDSVYEDMMQKREEFFRNVDGEEIKTGADDGDEERYAAAPKGSGPILVDTSVLYALTREDDLKHQWATRLFKVLTEQGRRLVTHGFVLGEAISLVDRRHGRPSALWLIDTLDSIETIWVDEGIFRTAAEAMDGGRRRVSFVDQVSIAIMRARGIQHAFAFDKDFRAAGFDIVGMD